MNRRIALLPGTTRRDSTYGRLLGELPPALARRGWTVRAFDPARGRPDALRAYNPALLHLHFSGHLGPRARPWLALARQAGAGLVVTFQDLDHPDMPAPTARARAEISSLVAEAAAVTALTPELAAAVRRRYPRARAVRVVGNGVSARWSAPSRRRDGPIVCVSRLSPYKGTDLLLWAFSSLSGREPRMRLALFGADFQNGHYQRLARRLRVDDRVLFAGDVGDERLKRALARAPLAVSAARRETYGMAVLEAMAAGAPVLATRTGAAGILGRHGRSAWLVPPGNADALGRALLRLWRDAPLRRRLGAGGRRLAARHNWDDRGARYDRIYREALRGL